MLSRSSTHYGTRWKTRKCIAFVLCHLENTPSHINKNRELKQRERERQRESYKTIDLITKYNHFMWECNHLAHRSPENKRNVGICWAKSLTGFKLDATYANIMQHRPTWCTNERKMLLPTCWHYMLRSFARALTQLRHTSLKVDNDIYAIVKRGKCLSWIGLILKSEAAYYKADPYNATFPAWFKY